MSSPSTSTERSDGPSFGEQESIPPLPQRILSILLVAFVIYAAYSIELNVFQQRATFLLMVLLYVFLQFPLEEHLPLKGRIRALSPETLDATARHVLRGIDGLFMIGTVVSLGYLVVNSVDVMTRTGIVRGYEVWLALLALFLVLEATRRSIGFIVPLLALISIAYVFYGQQLGGLLSTPGFSIERFATQQYLSTRGLFSFPLAVNLDYIYLFVLFGAILEFTGGGDAFLDLAKRLVGRYTGGPAKLAVVSSAFFGMLSGSTTANVVTTGAFTIPTMKEQGYESEFAGAVESAASTGGQLTPPVMGVVVFLMVQLTGIPYLFIIIHAILPAFLFFLGIFAAVHFQSVKEGLRGLPQDEIPETRAVVTKLWYFLPVVVLLYLLYIGRSLQTAILYSTLFLVAMTFATRSSRLYDPRDDSLTTSPLLRSLNATAKRATPIIAAATAIGIIVGNIGLTGIGLKIAAVIAAIGQEGIFLSLLLAALLCIMFGMTMTTIGVYIIVAVLVVPGLTTIGVPLFSAHMFVFYYGMLAMVTPPVCLAAYAASTIAESDPLKTGFRASVISAPAYLIPFAFVYDQSLLLVGAPGQILVAAITATVATVALAAGTMGNIYVNLNLLERALFVAAGVALMAPERLSDIVGVVVLLVAFARHYPSLITSIRKQTEAGRD